MSLSDWKKLATAPLAALLKTHGFRKKGLRFSARRDRCALVLWLQSSMSSNRDQLVITCNCEIWLDSLDGEKVWGPHWSERIGFYHDHPCDHWWTCTNKEEAIASGEEISTLVGSRALPEMERLASPDALQRLWASGKCPGLTEFERLKYLAQLRA